MDQLRKERIDRLLKELKHEITRGMMERKIEEEIGFRFFVPVSKHFESGVVECEFRTRPTPNVCGLPDNELKLKAVS